MVDRSGTKVNSQDELGRTALLEAAQGGKLGSINILLKMGADPNLRAPGAKLYAPLHYSAMLRHKVSVELLLDYGADVDIRTIKMETPLHLAAQSVGV